MENLGNIATILSALSPLFGLVVYFFKKILDKIDESAQRSIKVSSEVEKIVDQLKAMKEDVEKARVIVELANKHSIEIEVLRRDLTTCFEKLDNLTERVLNGN